MMSSSDKETPNTTKKEDNAASNGAASSSRQWSFVHKNPRIVRVSRTFGGKDRHSKVCTIKGLRDRRIRLSVPTAVQLYDLQDRLGLNQPSKVIDWLLDITKHDIDKLPPLPAMPGDFPLFYQALHTSQGFGTNPFIDSRLLPSRKEGTNMDSPPSIDVNNEDEDQDQDHSLMAKLRHWGSNSMLRSKQKDLSHDQDGVGSSGVDLNSQVSAQNFFPIASGSASILPSSTLLNNHPMFNYCHWEPSNLSLTQLGGHGLSSQNDDHQGNHSNNSNSLPSPITLSSGMSQLLLSPSMTTPSYFPPHASFWTTTHQIENDIRQLNRFHSTNNNNNPFSNSSLYSSNNGLALKSFPLSISHDPHFHRSSDNKEDKNNNDGSWKESSRN